MDLGCRVNISQRCWGLSGLWPAFLWPGLVRTSLASHPLTGGHRWQDGGWEVLPGRRPPAAPGGGRGGDLDRRGPHRPRGAAHAAVQGHRHPAGEVWGKGVGRGERHGRARL